MSVSAGHTDAGSRYGRLNQDKFFVVEKNVALVEGDAVQEDAQKKESKYGAWGVFDGHGLLGEYASRIASSTMQLNLEMSFGEAPECLREEVVSCFSTSHQNIIQSYNIAPLRYAFGDVATFVLSLASPDSEDIIYVNEEDPEDFRPLEFGTTAVIVFRKDNEYIIANAGNSHAVVGRVSSSATLLPPERLTTEHSIRNPEELRRVKEGLIDDANQEGELIDVSIEDTSVPRAGLTIVEGGYLVCEGMKLRATRALGHSMVTYSPSIRYYTAQPDDFVIVVASDGVWDNLPDDRVTEIALQHRASGPLVAAKSIVDAALEASLFPDYKDNTTAIVIFL